MPVVRCVYIWQGIFVVWPVSHLRTADSTIIVYSLQTWRHLQGMPTRKWSRYWLTKVEYWFVSASVWAKEGSGWGWLCNAVSRIVDLKRSPTCMQERVGRECLVLTIGTSTCTTDEHLREVLSDYTHISTHWVETSLCCQVYCQWEFVCRWETVTATRLMLTEISI